MKTTPHHRIVLSLIWMLSVLSVLAPRAMALQDDTLPAEGTPTPAVQLADPRLATPGVTLENFDKAMEAKDFGAAKLFCDFGTMEETGVIRSDAAGHLFNAMSRIEKTEASKISDPGDATTFVYYPNPKNRAHMEVDRAAPGHTITLSKNAIGEWRISAETLKNARPMREDFESKDLANRSGQEDAKGSVGEQIRKAMPPVMRETILTVEYWMWIAIFLIIFTGIVIDFIVRAVLSSVWHRLEKKRDAPSSDKQMLKRTVRPFGLVAAAAFWLGMINVGGIDGTALDVLLLAIRVILSVGSVWAAWRLTDLVADFLMRKASDTDSKYDDLLIPLFQRTLKIFIAAIGVIYIAKALHIDILPLLTGLGIGGLAVAFAAKDTIENFFGSVAVIVDQPFEVGDWIVVNDVEGTVEELGFRSTRVRTFYNSVVTVPNAMLVRATVDNYGKRQYRRWSTTLNLTYDTPPDKIEAFCEGIRELVRLHPYMRRDGFHVYLNSFGAHSLDVMLYVFFDCPDWAVELREKQRLMLDIIRLADRMGVGFAFPTQTLELKQIDPNLIHTPGAVPGVTAQGDAMAEGMTIARELTANQPWKSSKPGPVVYRAPRENDEHEIRGDGGGE